MKLLITGGHGQLACSLLTHPQKTGTLYAPSRDDLDITDSQAIENELGRFPADVIVNTAAYTAVDKAESAAEEAMRINAVGARNVALAARKHHIPLIHLSTDYIFDGTKKLAYQEDDTPLPLSVYGQSKLAGEEAVREVCQQYIILRISGIFSEYGQNFVKTILKHAATKTILRVVDDQMTCPTYAGDIAETIFTLIKKQQYNGTYHYCSHTPLSWYHFAVAIIAEARLSQRLPVEKVEKIENIPTSAYQTPAERPLNAVLDCQKIKSIFNIAQPSWAPGLQKTIRCL